MSPESDLAGPKWALPVLGAAGCLGVLLLGGVGGAVWYWQSRQAATPSPAASVAPLADPGATSPDVGVAPGQSGSDAGGADAADAGGDLGQVTSQPTFEASGSQAIRIGGSVRAPKKLRDRAPRYPSAAIERDIQGTVVVDALIEPSGRVAEVRVMRSIPALDDAAVAAVRQWVYEPTVIDGRPTAVILSVPVEFWLREEEYVSDDDDDGGVLIEERHRRERRRVLIEERHRRDRGRRVIVEERHRRDRGRRIVRETHRRD